MQATNMVQQDCASLLHLDQALTGIRAAINDSKVAEHLLVLNSTETNWKVQANLMGYLTPEFAILY